MWQLHPFTKHNSCNSDMTFFFTTPIHTHGQTPNPYLWLDLPIILNTILFDRDFHHRSFFEDMGVLSRVVPLYIMGVQLQGGLWLWVYLSYVNVKIQHKIVSKTISPNIIALHQQHKSYMYPNAIYCCNLKSIKVNRSMANKNKET
jgi:hypothetical protein